MGMSQRKMRKMSGFERHPETVDARIWPQFRDGIMAHLEADDDPALWQVAVSCIIGDAQFICPACGKQIVAQIGRCSHWLRPHQTRWTADGGFAWPTGYGGTRFSRSGLPEFDWHVYWEWLPEDREWKFLEPGPEKGAIRLRIAVPSRTNAHHQAAVHTLWTPGSPTTPRKPVVQFYGFRKHEVAWGCTAHHCADHRIYERVQPPLRWDSDEPEGTTENPCQSPEALTAEPGITHACTIDAAESSLVWWEKRRLLYNVGLIFAGVLAFICYVVVCCTLLPRVLDPSEIKVNSVTTFGQGIGYLFVMGVANICYLLGPLSEWLFRPRDVMRYRHNCYLLGFWFSVLTPFCIPSLLAILVLVFPGYWGH